MCSSSTSGEINIAMCAQKLELDNRIPLPYYYRIADKILQQADIFRAEKKIIDLIVMLSRFCSLACETIPNHREYRSYPQTKKHELKKEAVISWNELEKLKPLVDQKINELNSRNGHQQNGQANSHSNNSVDFSLMEKQTLTRNGQIKEKGKPKFAVGGCMLFCLCMLGKNKPPISLTRMNNHNVSKL